MPATDTTEFSDDLALLREAGAEAGRIALRYFRKNPEVWMKGGTSPVSEADYAADKYLRETLTAARPDYGWLSEETTDGTARLSARRTFVIDPIDGTRGFLEGGDQWCVSLAVVEEGRSLAGVLECPVKNETFWATPGGGSFLNGRKISVRAAGETLEIAGVRLSIAALPPALVTRVKRAHHVPSLAYRLAMVADGRLDATFVKPNAHDWDLAAADLILHEAGGTILDAAGRPPIYGRATISHGHLVAGSGALLRAMADAIAGAAN